MAVTHTSQIIVTANDTETEHATEDLKTWSQIGQV